jgi:hypothetical protein
MCFSFLSFHRRTVKDKEDQGTHFLAGKLESSLVTHDFLLFARM